MIRIGDIIDNRTICDVHGVGSMGGIRVNKSRNLIVLISNNTDPTYRNEWQGDTLHFVGMGSVGPQKLDRQNWTLANANKSRATLHLFEVFERGRYTYAGEVELAGEPYMADQPDARADSRFVWIFPLRRKHPNKDSLDETQTVQSAPGLTDHLPHGAYAVIGVNMREHQVKLVNEALDRLKAAGITVLDRRDIEERRYEKARDRWYDAVLDHVRARVKEMIAKRKQRAKAENRPFALIDDEFKINAASTEAELRQALIMLDMEGVATQQLFDEAMAAVPMPEAPQSLQELVDKEPMQAPLERYGAKRIDRSRLRDIT